jgi:hypothetical protein
LTVDRELDLISQIINWARKTLRIHLHESPMYGVRRPRYFNERDRRLSPEEERRLFESARAEDRLLARERALEAALAPARREAQMLPNESAREAQREKCPGSVTPFPCECISSLTNVTGGAVPITHAGETCRASSRGSTSAASPHRPATRCEVLRR